MRKSHIIVVVAGLLAVALPGVWYFMARPSGDALKNDLRSLGYWPITPPSTLMNLGSLYYVDSDVKFFKTLCSVSNDDLKSVVMESASTNTIKEQHRSGKFSIGIKLKAETVGSGQGDAGNKFVTMVHYSLTDVHLSEIALDVIHGIYDKLVARQDCSAAITDYIDAGGYICQGQQILKATVVYEVGDEANAGMRTDPTAVLKAVKVALQAQSGAQLLEKSGRLETGTALDYGVVMTPKCLTPSYGIFQRSLPRSGFDRVMNFIKFRLIEPILVRV